MSEKVKCPKCFRFIGWIRDDGTGPVFDDCPEGLESCPMHKALAQYQPHNPHRHIGCGNGHVVSPGLDGIGSYREIAVRALEDG